MRFLLSAGLTLWLAAPALAAPPVTILFVGNSFCHGAFQPVLSYNAAAVVDENKNLPSDEPRALRPEHEKATWGGIPGIFKKLTDEAGLSYEVHMELASGKDLKFHHENALPVIAQSKWNVVVLQEYSTNPLPPARGGKPGDFLAYTEKIEQAIHAANAAARVYLYETWPRADLTYPAGKPYHDATIDTMAGDLHASYDQVAKEDGHMAAVAHAGDAWLNAIHQGAAVADPYHPAHAPGQMDLWGKDSYHPSIYGAYLSALVLFQEITGVAPHTLGPDEAAAHDLGISKEDTVKLQATAETVAPAHH